MKSFLTFLQHPTQFDSDAVIRSVIFLRLVILSLMLLSVLYSHLAIERFDHWTITLATLGVTLLWSIFVLLKSDLQRNSTAALREILVDISWIFIVVYFSGRSTNPFIYYYLVIIAYAAILLNRQKAWMLCSLGVMLYSGLLLADVQAHFAHFSIDFKNHLIGMWINYVGSSVVITFFVSSLIQALRSQQEKLLAVREHHLKNEQLIGLATVSASTVHNLATPLSTLSVLIDDFEEDKTLHATHSADLNLMREQIFRCRSTMKELAQLANQSNHHSLTYIKNLFKVFEEHYSLHFPNNLPKLINNTGSNTAIVCTPLFKYAVINLLNNAIESSTFQAILVIESNSHSVVFSITNRVTDAGATLTERWGQPTASKKEFGLGIGSFLANSTIEQQGGSVSLSITSLDDTLDQSRISIVVEMPNALLYQQSQQHQSQQQQQQSQNQQG